MPASVLRLSISDAAQPAVVSPWPTIAAGCWAPPATQDLAGHLEAIADKLDRLLTMLTATRGDPDERGTLPIASEQPLVDQAELAAILRTSPRTIRDLEAGGQTAAGRKSGAQEALRSPRATAVDRGGHAGSKAVDQSGA